MYDEKENYFGAQRDVCNANIRGLTACHNG